MPGMRSPLPSLGESETQGSPQGSVGAAPGTGALASASLPFMLWLLTPAHVTTAQQTSCLEAPGPPETESFLTFGASQLLSTQQPQ